MEKTYERRRKEERKPDHNDEKEDCVLLDLDNFMTLDAVGSVDGELFRQSEASIVGFLFSYQVLKLCLWVYTKKIIFSNSWILLYSFFWNYNFLGGSFKGYFTLSFVVLYYLIDCPRWIDQKLLRLFCQLT